MNAKKLKRGLALFLSVVMLLTSSMEVPVFAESAQDEMVSENKADQGIQGDETPQENTTSENEVVLDGDQISQNKTTPDGEQVSENEIVSENQTVSEDTVSQDVALSGTENSIGIPMEGVTVQPGPYSADISVSINSTKYIAHDFCILYSNIESNLPTEEKISSINESGLKKIDYYRSETYSSGTKQSISFKTDEIPPLTTFYYQLFYYQDSTYYKITPSASFKTKEPITPSRISFTDFTVKEVGYTEAKVEFQMFNPDNEYIIDNKIYVTDGTNKYSTSKIYDENGFLIPGMYTSDVFLGKDQSKNFMPEVKVYTDKLEEKKIAGTPITISANASAGLQVTCTPTGFVNSAVMNIKLDPYYPVDCNGMNISFSYNPIVSGSTLTETRYVKGSDNSISLTGLTKNTKYGYTLDVYDDSKQTNLLKSCTGIFQTREDQTYTADQFDKQIFDKIKSKLSITSDTVKQSELEDIKSFVIDSDSENVTTPVQSLKGVEYLINLSNLEITGQDISSASEIKDLTSLKYVVLNGNKLTEMPDLSKLVEISYDSDLKLNYNTISSDLITEAKLPDNMSDKSSWIRNTRQMQMESAPQCITADTYYAVGVKHPFLFEADNFPTCRNYALTVSVNGTKNTLDKKVENNVSCYYFPDLGITEGTYPVVMTLTDCYGKVQWEKTRTIQFVGDEGVVKDAYADASDEQVSVTGYIPGNSEVTGVQLKNADGVVVGKDSDKYSYVDGLYDNRYKEIFTHIDQFNNVGWSNMCFSATVKFSKVLAAGDYKLVVTTKDGKEHLFANIVHISAKTIITGMDTNSYQLNRKNDNSGEYYYVELNGLNIDPQKVWPVIHAKDGKEISEKGSVAHYENNTYQYQLKKINKDTKWIDGSTFNVTIGSESGYEFVDSRTNKTFTYHKDIDHILSQYYNYRSSTNKYRVHFDSKVTNETKVNIKLYSDGYYTTQLAVAEGTVTNGWANLNLKDLQGNEFVPDRDKKYSEKIVYSGNYKGIDRNSYEIIWYGINSYSSSSISYVLNSEDAIRKTDSESIDFAITLPKQTDTKQTFKAYLGKASNSKQGEAVKLSAKETTFEGKKCVKLTGKRTGTALDSGKYYLSVYYNDTLQATPQIAVYNNDLFYMEYFHASESSSGEYIVQFNSSQLKGEYKKVYHSKVSDADALKLVKNSYTVEVCDLLGNEIKGWSVKSASYSNNDILIGLTGIPADYKGCYIKILSKTKSNKEGYTLDGKDSTVYYGQKLNNVDPNYGYYATSYKTLLTFQTSYVTHDQSTYWTSYDSIDILVRSGMLPVTVQFYKIGEKAPVKTLTINKYGRHPFTSSELSGISPTEVYVMTAESADHKQCTNKTGYVGVITSSADVPEPEITLSLDQTSISMQEGNTAKLTATPSSTTQETLSWSSSNPKVAAVDNGTVTAIGAGTAMITASLSDGASAKCQIVVAGKSDSDAIDVAGTTIKAVKKQNYTGQMITPKLTVMNGKVALVENADYILSYRDNKNAGTDTAVAVIYGIGAYKGTKEINFTIAPKAIKGASIEAYDMTATGMVLSPAVIIMDNGMRLTEGEDYNITGLKNTQKAGTGKFTIEGTNNYTGKKAGSFKIYPANTKILTGWSISANIPVSGYTYDAIKKTPVITVKDAAGTVLQLNKDYTVSYKNNVNAGTAIAIVKGKGTNKGTKDCYFKIKPLNVSTDTTIDEIAAVNYSGGALYPRVVVKSKAGKKLRLNKDYTLAYSNNYQASTTTGAKTATVVITGIGNYNGTVTKDFLINKIVLGKGFSVKELKTQIYTGKELTPTFKLYYKKRLLKQGQDYTVTYKNNVEVGKGEIEITAVENSSFTGKMTKTFKIKK